jgi:hypothetical protein
MIEWEVWVPDSENRRGVLDFSVVVIFGSFGFHLRWFLYTIRCIRATMTFRMCVTQSRTKGLSCDKFK